MFWLATAAFAGDVDDPGCRGRVRERDSEVVFEFMAEATEGLVRTVEIRPGTGPEEGRASVQGRLRSQLHAFIACYDASFGDAPGPDLRMTVSFDVERGRPERVTVDGAAAHAPLKECVRREVARTPMVCKLDATGFLFPLRFRTETPAP